MKVESYFKCQIKKIDKYLNILTLVETSIQRNKQFNIINDQNWKINKQSKHETLFETDRQTQRKEKKLLLLLLLLLKENIYIEKKYLNYLNYIK